MPHLKNTEFEKVFRVTGGHFKLKIVSWFYNSRKSIIYSSIKKQHQTKHKTTKK